jgi:crossover junction endodeoxyribonuclease RuvC
MRILGIDPGSHRTGFAILEAIRTGPQHISSGTIVLDPKLSIETRLLILDQDLENIISKYEPSEMAIETVFFAKNAQSALRLGEARGVILRRAAQHKLKVFEYAPTEIKSAIGGSGRAKKDQIARLLRLFLKLPQSFKFQSSDQSDALAIGLAHAQTRGGKLSRAQQGKGKNDRSTFWQTHL